MARFRAVGCVTRHRSRPFPGPAATSAPRRLPRVSDPRGADEFARGASAATLRVATVPRPNRSAAAPCPAHGTRNGFSSRFRVRRIARERHGRWRMSKARRRIIAGQSATEFEDGRGGTVSISGAKRRLPSGLTATSTRAHERSVRPPPPPTHRPPPPTLKMDQADVVASGRVRARPSRPNAPRVSASPDEIRERRIPCTFFFPG
jgi:hypothetical protein